jgi:mannose-6-phosphate isomerase-like protein (cupin superfamily)
MHIPAEAAPLFELPGLKVHGLAAPSRGARETCVWKVTVEPGCPGQTHAVDREEIFVAVSGQALLTLDGSPIPFGPGDAVIVPPHRPFSLAPPTSSRSRP